MTCWHHGHTGDLCGKLVSVKYLCFALLSGLAGQLAVFSGERLGEEVFLWNVLRLLVARCNAKPRLPLLLLLAAAGLS